MLLPNFGKSIAKVFGQNSHHLVHHWLFDTQKRVIIAHRTAQNPTDNITRTRRTRQQAIGNRKGNRPNMVGNYPNGYICFRATLKTTRIFYACLRFDKTDKRRKNIGIIRIFFALNSHTKPLETHTRINMTRRQQLETAIGFTIIHHKDIVPNLNHLGVVLVHQRSPIYLRPFVVGTHIKMDFATWATWPLRTHLPKIIFFIAPKDVATRQMRFPNCRRFVVSRDIFCLVASKNRRIQTVFRQLVNLRQQFPTPSNSRLLKIIAKRPIAQHLKQRMVRTIHTHILEVVVLTRHPQTLLRIGNTRRNRCLIPQKTILKRCHSRVHKHQRRVGLVRQRCRRHNLMPARLKKIQKRASYFVSSHHKF